MGINKRLITFRLGGKRLIWVFLATMAAGGLLTMPSAWSQSSADSARTAALPPDAPTGAGAGSIELPKPLTAIDADRYRDIFRLQREGNWRAADRLIDSVTDLRLLGHVLAQRYLHPTAYRSTYRELRNWLAAYADYPDAPAIYRLAVKRMPTGGRPPAEPTVSIPTSGTPDWGIEPESPHWQAGLDAWRRGRIADAASHFEKVALAEERSPWNRAAGAFWAARSHLKARQPEQVSRWLAMAAEYPRTFYGQIARRSLGMDSVLDWEVRPLVQAEARALLGTQTGQRALALLQIGERDRAERELRILQTQAGPELADALFAISQAAEMPALALRLGVVVKRQQGKPLDAALYPLPGWRPEGGFIVDRALLFALMRQESAFNPDAESPAGAMGLMQLMPQTAAYIAGDGTDFTGKNRVALRDPALNLTLAQKYVDYLLGDANVGGDLMLLAVAYNAGPGNLAKWRNRLAYEEDPLLFIETIPMRETRLFIERVLTNLWIYRERMNQRAPSLDALAAGGWPVYHPQDLQSADIADIR